MAEGQRASAAINVGANGSQNVTVSDFSTTEGTALGASDAVIVTGYIHANDATFNRIGDPNADSTFEINVAIESRTGAGERTDVSHLVTDAFGIEVAEDSGNAQDVVLYGVRVDASKVFVVQAAGVADASEIERTVAARGQEETIYELVMSGDADLIRRHDGNDDGTFETAATVDSFTGADVKRELILPMKDEAGRTNPEWQTALQASGGSRDLALAGTIGVSL